MSRSHRQGGRRDGGFTLIELLVVITIGALVMGTAIRGLRSLAKSDLRQATSQLSGAIRYLFDRASTTGKHHRLVLDLNEGRYWAEVSDDKFYIPHEAENVSDISRREAAEEVQDEKDRRLAEERANRDVAGTGGGSFDAAKMEVGDFRPKRVRFAAFKEMALKPATVKNAKLADVFTPRVSEPITGGRAYIYFFPMGQTEPAMIHLSDLSGESFYTIVVHPITGRVRIYDTYIDAPVTEQYDDAGNRIER